MTLIVGILPNPGVSGLASRSILKPSSKVRLDRRIPMVRTTFVRNLIVTNFYLAVYLLLQVQL